MAYVFQQGLPNGFLVRGARYDIAGLVDAAVESDAPWIMFDLIGEEKFANLRPASIVAVIDDEEE